MASMLPGLPSDFSVLEFVRIVTRTEEQVKNLTQAMIELRRSVEEMVDRLEADADEMRTSLGGLIELRNGHTDLGRRLAEVESKAARLEIRVTDLETWRTTEKAWMAALGFVSGIIGSAIYFVAGKIWK